MTLEEQIDRSSQAESGKHDKKNQMHRKLRASPISS
jgi:hypothetical protein